MNVEGKLLEKYDTQTIKETFRKREFVLEYAENPQYPEFVKFELIQSNCEQLDTVNIGDSISVNFNLKGRKWTDRNGEVKYFNSLQAWKIEKKSESTPSGMPETPPPDDSLMNFESSADGDDDDLPF